MSDRDLLAQIHGKAANYLAAAKLPLTADTHAAGLFNGVEEIWNMTLEAWEQVNGPSGDDGRDFTEPYEP